MPREGEKDLVEHSGSAGSCLWFSLGTLAVWETCFADLRFRLIDRI